MPIQIDLDIVWKPGLDPEEHPAKPLIIIIKIVVLTFGRSGCNFQMFGGTVWFYSGSFTGLYGRKGADKPCFVRSLFIVPPGEIPLINLSGIQILKRTSLIPNISFHVGTKGVCLLFGKGIKILE